MFNTNEMRSITGSHDIKQQQISCLSLDATQAFVAVGCSSSVKLLKINSSHRHFDEVSVLQFKSFGNYTFTDIAWSKTMNNEGKLACSTTNGNIVVFNLSDLYGSGGSPMGKKSYQDWENQEITRSVHRICWHPTESDLLLAASQDGNVRIFDCRKKISSCQSTFNSRADAARDAQFHPLNPNLFASIFETGSLFIWDIRNTEKELMKIPAHTNCGLSMAWHLTNEHRIATGSRNGDCKIWNIDSFGDEVPKQTYTLHTPSAVSKISWRPRFDNQLATSSEGLGEITIWNITVSNIPACILKGHNEQAVVDFEWLDTTLSPPRDNKKFLNYYQHIISASKEEKVVVQDIRCGYFPHQHIASSVAAISSNGHVCFAKSQVNRSNLLSLTVDKLTRDAQGLFLENQANFGMLFSAAPLDSIGVSGGKKAPQCGAGQLYVGWADINDLNQAREIRKDIGRGLEGALFDPAMVSLLARNYKLGDKLYDSEVSSNAVSIDTVSNVSKVNWNDILEPSHSILQICEHNLKTAAMAGLHSRVTIWESLLILLPSIIARHSNGAYKIKVNCKFMSDNIAETVNGDSLLGLCFGEELVGKLLNELLDSGDCQHFVVICEILRNTGSGILTILITEKKIVNERRKQEAYFAYLDLLSKLQLHCSANTIIKSSDVENISRLSMQGVMMHSACAKCGKELQDNVPLAWCAKCSKCASICHICHKPVRGLFHWCPVCCHGGHIECTRKWFNLRKTCASGCGHNCVQSLQSLK